MPHILQAAPDLVAVSPMTPDQSLDMKTTNALRFEVFSDAGNIQPICHLTYGPNGPIVYLMVIGRPREFDTDRALDAAMHLFWRQGYEATSMQNLLDTMNLSKSSLYQTFGSKHDLFQRCLQHYRNMMTTGLKQELKQAATARSFIEHFYMSLVDRMKDPVNRIGCLVMNSASELAQRDEDIAKAIKQGTESFIKVFYAAVKQAQSEGDIPKDKDAQSLAHYLMSSLAGLNSMAKAGASQTVLNNIVKEILQSLD